MVKVVVYVSEDTALIEEAVATLVAAEPQREALLFPEVRLHPTKHWGAVREAVYGSSPVVIGTHSEGVVGRLADAIGFGHIRAEAVEVRVLLPAEDPQPDDHVVCPDGRTLGDWRVGAHAVVSRFRADGTLDASWPFGFFVPLNDRGNGPKDPTPEAP